MREAVVALAFAERCERGWRRYARRMQRHVFKPRYCHGVEPIAREFRPVAAKNEVLLRARHSLALAPPAVMLQSCAGHGCLLEFPREFWLAAIPVTMSRGTAASACSVFAVTTSTCYCMQ